MDTKIREDKILDVKNLRISFHTNGGTVKAVRGISFSLYRGRTLAIVGESGSGKSVTSKAILGILANNKIVEDGQIIYDGQDLLKIDEDHFHKIRGVKIGMIFQDPLSSLNPIMTVGKQLTEAMILKQKSDRKEARRDLARIKKALKAVDPELYRAYEEDAKKKRSAVVPSFYENGLLSAAKHILEVRSIALEKILPDFQEVLSDDSPAEKKWTNIASFQKTILDPAFTYLVGERETIAAYSKSILATAHSGDPKSIVEPMDKALEALSQKDDPKTPEALVEPLLSELSSYSAKVTGGEKPNANDIHPISAFLTAGKEDSLAARLESQAKALVSALEPRKHSELFSKLAAKELNKRVEAASAIIPILNEIVDTAFIGEDTDILGTILKLRKHEKDIAKCVLPSFSKKDNIIEVFPAILKDIKRSFKNSLKDEKRLQKSFKKYGVSDFFDLPAKERAKLPESLKSRKEIAAELLSATNELIDRLKAIVEEGDSKAEAILEELYKTVEEALAKLANRESKKEIKIRAISMLGEVGIDEPKRRFVQYPFELSGGMRQRIVIAIALCSSPEILICDEPTTALDVTIQAQILELINKLKKDRNLSIIFITHDLGVVANMADDIAVMYAGKIVEYGTDTDIFYDPRHPYTWALLGSMPDLDTEEQLSAIPGTPPNMLLPPKGDAFAGRNAHALAIDFERQPPFFQVSDTHFAATWNLHPSAPDLSAPEIVVARIKKALDAHPEFTPKMENAKNSVLNGIGKGE